LFDRHVALMIVFCHMAGFAATELIKEVNLASFVRSNYTVITDPNSKFEVHFKEALLILNIHHHLKTRGHHEAILVEGFN
jgi:hypothetical protein